MKKKVIILGLIGILILCGYYFVINRQIPMNEIEQVLLNEVEANKSPSVQYYLFDKDKISLGSIYDAFGIEGRGAFV